MKETALVIGASSGIGREIALLLAGEGLRVGVAARRQALLEELSDSHQNIRAVSVFDVSEDNAEACFQALWDEAGDVSEVYVVAGTGFLNQDLDWALEERTIRTNVDGFARICCAAMKRLEKRGGGRLVGVSSIAAMRGAGEAPAYGASKAFASRYLQALRFRGKKTGVTVTDARPGFVDTAMMKAEKPFWIATPRKAAEQIISAARQGRGVVYVSRRWSLIGWLLKLLPE